MSSSEPEHDVYSPELLTMLQAIWGDGFLAPGGPEAVDSIIADLDVVNKTILDIGSAMGGPSFHMAEKRGVGKVVGIDVQDQLVDQARAVAREKGLSDRIEFMAVKPGPLPFADSEFDIVFSKDSIIHVSDKAGLVGEIWRVLKPGGKVAIGDWFGGIAPLSPEAEAWLEATGLTLALKPIEEFATLFNHAGFAEVHAEDRNVWYVDLAKKDVEALQGDTGRRIAAKLGEEAAEDWLQRATNRSVIAQQGHLRPGNVWAGKPS
jgi:phosphoethanolamine N-methyltransferase